MKKIVVVFALAIVALLSVSSFRAYLDRPTVEVSAVSGKCVRAYGPKGSMSCAQAMKGTYEVVYVAPSQKLKKPLI